MISQSHILHHKCNQTVVCKADNLFIVPPYLFKELFTGNALEISLQREWQIDNSFFLKLLTPIQRYPNPGTQ